MTEIETEAEKWRHMLKRILDLILFMAEREREDSHFSQ